MTPLEAAAGLLLAACGWALLAVVLPALLTRGAELAAERADAERARAQATAEELLPPGVSLSDALELADRRGIPLADAALLLHETRVRVRLEALVRRRLYADRFAAEHPNLAHRPPTEETHP